MIFPHILLVLLSLWVLYEIFMFINIPTNSRPYFSYLQSIEEGKLHGISRITFKIYFSYKSRALKKKFKSRTLGQSVKILAILKELHEGDADSLDKGLDLDGKPSFSFFKESAKAKDFFIVNRYTNKIIPTDEIELYIFNYLLLTKQLQTFDGYQQQRELEDLIKVYENVYSSKDKFEQTQF